jgi:hypothetical protein
MSSPLTGGRAAGAHQPDGVLVELDVHHELDPVLLGLRTGWSRRLAHRLFP